MQFLKISQILTLSWLINALSLVLAYEPEKCPPPWQRKLRAKALCNASPDKYSCLYDVIQQRHKESCSGKADYVKPGKRYVIRGDRDNDNCIDARYQPVKLWSNRSSECEYIKNGCNEIGQVLVSNGSTTKDRTCRCDYTKGFDFLIRPINLCYCIPSEEDCSCYRKRCSSNEILTKDYECVSKVNLDGQNYRCSPIGETRKASFGTSSTLRVRPLSSISPLDESDINMQHHNWLWIVVSLTIAITCFMKVVLIYCTTLRLSNLIEQTQSFNIISVNKTFLMEEMDVDIMLKGLKKEGFGSGLTINPFLERRERAKIICEYLEKQPPIIMDTIYKILKKNKQFLMRNTLKESERIFGYAHVDFLKDRISKNSDEIVECLTENGKVEWIISVLKEKDDLKQNVDVVWEDNCIDEKNKIYRIIELVKNAGLHPMLQFAYALFIVGEDKYEKKLLQTEAEDN